LVAGNYIGESRGRDLQFIIMIITITGKQGEGTTTLVRQLLKKSKSVFIYEHDLKNKEWLLEIDDSIDFLVVDLKKPLKLYSEDEFTLLLLSTAQIV